MRGASPAWVKFRVSRVKQGKNNKKKWRDVCVAKLLLVFKFTILQWAIFELLFASVSK